MAESPEQVAPYPDGCLSRTEVQAALREMGVKHEITVRWNTVVIDWLIAYKIV